MADKTNKLDEFDMVDDLDVIDKLDNELVNEFDNKLVNELDNKLVNELVNELAIEVSTEPGSDFSWAKKEKYSYTTRKKPLVPIEGLVEPIYERQPKEPLPDYKRFLCYRGIPTARRTYQEGWETWWRMKNPDEDPDKASRMPSSWKTLPQRWHWQDRAMAWDTDQAARVHQTWLERDMERREADFRVGNELRKKAETALEKLNMDTAEHADLRGYIMLATKLQQEASQGMVPRQGQVREFINSLPVEMRQKVIQLLLVDRGG